MLYNFNGNLINLLEVVAVEVSASTNSQYPYLLTVKLKDNRSYGVCYATEAGRRQEMNRIQAEANRAFRQLYPPSIERIELEAIVKREVQKLKPEIRILKKMLEGGEEHG